MITGFFMARSKFDLKKSYKRVLSTYLIILFYSVVLSVVTILLGTDFRTVDGNVVSISGIVHRMIFPISSQQWYFFTSYIILCLLAPFINKLVQSLTKRQYGILLLVLISVMSVWMCLAQTKPFSSFMSINNYQGFSDGKNAFSFVLYYMIGGYMGMHTKPSDKPKFRYLLIFFASVGVVFLFNTETFKNLDIEFGGAIAWGVYSNPFILLAAASIVMFFKDLHFYSRAVNLAASVTIGVYAIHEFSFVRNYLWQRINFNNYDCTNVGLNIARILAVIVGVFVACGVLELIRQQLFKLVTMIIGKIRAEKQLNQKN